MKRWIALGVVALCTLGRAEEKEALEPCPEVPSMEEAGKGGSGFDVEKPAKAQWERGVSIQAGGGVEGFTGSLAPRIQPGLAYGVQVLFKPTRILGFELAYSGAAHEVNLDYTQLANATSGADIVRNGAAASVNVVLSPQKVQPYLHGGIGISRYTPRKASVNYGFQADTEGNIPLGAGIRTYVGGLVADLRGTYSVLFDEGFAQNVETRNILGINSISAGRYTGTLQLGYIF